MNQSKAFPFGRYLDEFAPGDVYEHWPRKTVTESDNNLFCLLTMNHHPVHLDDLHASAAHHGRILVVGTYVFSVVVGMTVRDVSGLAIANLAYHDVQHDGPVFVGDTLQARTEVLAVRASRKRTDRGVVRVRTRACNQNGEPVLTFERSVLVPRRPTEESHG